MIEFLRFLGIFIPTTYIIKDDITIMNKLHLFVIGILIFTFLLGINKIFFITYICNYIIFNYGR